MLNFSSVKTGSGVYGSLSTTTRIELGFKPRWLTVYVPIRDVYIQYCEDFSTENYTYYGASGTSVKGTVGSQMLLSVDDKGFTLAPSAFNVLNQAFEYIVIG